jgi:hypothetical protein
VDVTQKAKKGRERWRLFGAVEPGHRFRTRYNNHRKRRERDVEYGKLLNLFGGPALVVAGFALPSTPDPSYVISVMGLWMLAGGLLPPECSIGPRYG